MQTCAECILCLLNRDLEAVPPETGAAEKAAYQREVLRLVADSDPSLCAAQINAKIDSVFKARFGERKTKNFSELKRIYNERMLALEPRLRNVIAQSDDPLATAILLARVGNYIDFGAKHEVNDSLFDELLANIRRETLNPEEYTRFRQELSSARSVAYVTDNAGEIVLDKLLLKELLKQYPNTDFTVMVRGAPTLNDATVEDAKTVGITELAPVMGNGSGLAGTIWQEISDDARKLLENADVIISKGQANFETLYGCGLNIYYLLLCKCDYFVRRFGVAKLTGMFVNEHRMPFVSE
ncbi:MAG: ARMT1-like domain-containing protein [Eubacteriales bacterium]|nr:ARMT1-like domain-containing protein [Eubacteriales bacterium]